MYTSRSVVDKRCTVCVTRRKRPVASPAVCIKEGDHQSSGG